uniref:DWNN domain-containing protein n=1 Tax=Neogobius melanostomus TaxID=47308 RepID=A0A8C6WRN1_9GOBI
MTHVHYKFSSKRSYNTVVFDGVNITLFELKRLIMTTEKLRATDSDLQITNAQTKEEYTDDDSQIPRGSSVIVRRVPSRAGKSSSGKSSSSAKIRFDDISTNFKILKHYSPLPHLYTILSASLSR